MPLAKRKQRVIVVDDDEAVRDSLSALLVAEGYQVKFYASATEFLRHEHGRTSDCLILDHNMKRMTGLALAERLRAEDRRLPMILISGNLTAATRKRAEKLDIVTILEKPFSDEELLSAVRQVLANVDDN